MSLALTKAFLCFHQIKKNWTENYSSKIVKTLLIILYQKGGTRASENTIKNLLLPQIECAYVLFDFFYIEFVLFSINSIKNNK